MGGPLPAPFQTIWHRNAPSFLTLQEERLLSGLASPAAVTGLEKETPRLLPPIDTARSRLGPLTVNTGPVVTPHRHDEGLLSPSFALHQVVNVHSGYSPRGAPPAAETEAFKPAGDRAADGEAAGTASLLR